MLRNRKGVSLLEIMTVITMAAIMTAFAIPALKNTRRASSMQSAKTQLESFLSVARSAAIRNGERSYLIRDGNTIKILADSMGTAKVVVRPATLDPMSKVAFSNEGGTTADTIIYDPRGLAINLDGTKKFYVSVTSGYGAGAKDSVCVTRLGLVLDAKCGLSVKPPEKEELPPDIILDPKDGGPIISTPPITVGPVTVGPITVK